MLVAAPVDAVFSVGELSVTSLGKLVIALATGRSPDQPFFLSQSIHRSPNQAFTDTDGFCQPNQAALPYTTASGLEGVAEDRHQQRLGSKRAAGSKIHQQMFDRRFEIHTGTSVNGCQPPSELCPEIGVPRLRRVR